ncbi:TB2/DP1 proteinHVA22 family protein [Aphelenchoides avenae]|nr:TB2/DP1 proteinHVA22 family protein [Aphelenchus avenae]
MAATAANPVNAEAAQDQAAGNVPPAQVESLSDIQPQLLKLLYAEDTHPLLLNALVALETNTNVKRERLFYGFAGVVAVYLIIGALAQLLCNLIGFGYPAYASVKAVRTETKDDDTQWLIYWTVFATFSLADFWADAILHYFPIYYLAKVVFLLYLSLPQTRGAIKLYYKVVDPLCAKLEAAVANYLANAASAPSATAFDNATQQPQAPQAPAN